jgi:hypothetical protein
MEKNRGDEPIQVIIHMYMEISHGNCLYSYLKQTKINFFLLQNWRTGGQDRSCLGAGITPVEGRMWEKGIAG